MPGKWIGCMHQGQVGKRWSSREKAHRYDRKYKSCNAGGPEYDMPLHAEFATEPMKDYWPCSVQRVRLPSVSMGAR